MVALCKNCSSKENGFTATYISTPLPDIQKSLRGQGTSDKHEISQLLQYIELDMRNICSEILRLQSAILSLRTKREQLEKLRANASSLTAPIRRLPTEILSRIFLTLCSTTSSNFSTSRLKRFISDAPPFVLSTVCARWRDIVHSTSGMWSNLSLNLCPSDKESNSVGPPVELHLERSRKHPLCLDIEMWLHSDSEQEHRLMYTLAKHSQRWQHVTVRTGILSVECYDSLASLGSLPCLRSLRINQTLRGEIVDELPNLSLFKDAPCLQVLALNCSPHKDHATANGFPWEQIRDLELDAGSRTVFRVVEFCPNLESVSYTNAHHAVMTDGADGLRQPSDVIPQKSQSLRSLSISLLGKVKPCGYNMLELLISSLTAPSLTSITIKSESSDPKRSFEGCWPRAQFAEFLSRSNCSITTLRLESIPLSDKDAIAFLELLPLLQDLTIIEALPPSANPNALRRATARNLLYTPTICKGFLEALHRCGHSSSLRSKETLVPMLRRLELGARSPFFDDSTFISMLVSRWVPEIADDRVECLRFIRLRFAARKLAADACRELEYLEHAGLIVEVVEESSQADYAIQIVHV